MATEGRSLRSGRTLPDPSDPLDPTLVEGESEGESEEEEDTELWVDNERYDIIGYDVIMTSLVMMYSI